MTMFLQRTPVYFTLLLVVVLAPSCGAPVPAPDSRSGYVDVEHGRIFYEMHHAEAPGTPLVMIHGGPGSTSCYFGLLDELITDRPVIRYDQLGTGLSDRPATTSYWHLEHFVSEIDALRDALDLDEVHLLGSSWGGAVAAEYALTTPALGLKSLILAGPLLSTPRWLEDATSLIGELPEDLQAVIRKHEAAGTFDNPEYLAATDSFYARFLYHQQPPRDVPECDGVSGNTDMYEAMWGPSEFTATGTLLDYDRTGVLDDIRVPTLLIAGEFDEARPETMHEFAALIPDARVEVLDDAGHVSMVDQPIAFAHAVTRFLARIEPQQP
ncbi:MAG: hypothetical protein COV99_05335 [Bacteroidetes bacterium CG12_big_fil_rev_8_21_14_0_65_60_17]|nr:MAG: hypothetical protein COV99_05335 [Bacteroidetes bacterium CG12_big_fil_rev_8_21_14_0_65_60_17]